jgi:hypothetical protein
VSFFDEGDEPPTRTQRAARPSGGGARTGGIAADPQTVRNRRIIAVVFVVLFIVLLSVLVNSCLDTRAENRLKDYNRDVGSVIGRSDREVGRPFFDLISQGGAAPNELEQSISSLRNRADDHVQEAEGFDVPDELKTAQRNLLLALDMRAAGLEKIAGQVRTALVQDGGEEAEAATAQIAAQMQQFLSSDVIYDARVTPYIQQTLVDKDIAGQTVPGSRFLPSLEWLDVEVVADRLGAEAGDAGGGGNARGEPAPGLHGHGLVSVRVGDLALEPGETANRIPAGSDIAFDVEFANQGENPERNVPVRVRIRGQGIKTISAVRRVEQTQQGENATASVPLQQAPPIGTPVTIEVSVEKVPGEEKVDNNRQTYTAIFTR